MPKNQSKTDALIELRAQARKLTDGSPTLEKNPAEKARIMDNLESLDEQKLRQLLEILRKEEAMWRELMDRARHESRTKAQEMKNQAVGLQKKARQAIQQEREHLEKNKTEPADDLLNDLP